MRAQLVSEGDIVSDLYMVIEGEVVVIDSLRGGGGGSDSNGASMGASMARTNSGGASYRR